MKYLQAFEERSINYAYMKDADDVTKMKSLVKDFIKDKKIIEEINDLTFYFFVKCHFSYRDVWDDLFTYTIENNNTIGRMVNIYQFIYSFKFKGTTPETRNTLFDIINDLYDEYNIEDKLNKKLIELLEKEPTKYPVKFKNYGDDLNDIVKDACRWMLDAKKYNL